mmetsp:Transcript_10688/g.34193  ORF Transcript_10688/g.34193 Transcript_10688/m.34193 type:complete len:232 (-) Transcript_10688:277-972(-)
MRRGVGLVAAALPLLASGLVAPPLSPARRWTARGEVECGTPARLAPRVSSPSEVVRAASAAEDETPKKGLRARLAAQLDALKSKSKGDLASMGMTSFFAYGIVSNFNSVLLIAFTWASFRRANPTLSPLSDTALLLNPGTWFPLKKAFMALYVGIYATVGSVMRPFRFGLAIAITPKLDSIYKGLQSRLRVSKAVAIFLVTLVVNIGLSVALLVFSIYAFCFALRVSPLPL